MRENKTNMQMSGEVRKQKILHSKINSIFLSSIALLAFTSCATTESVDKIDNRTKYTPEDIYKVNVTNPYTPQNLIGKKLVRVALLAPYSSNKVAIKTEAEILKSATQMALDKYGDGQTVLYFIDSGETPAEAANAAKQAISSGADFVLGPLFASGVAAAAQYTRANKTTLFSFSTDTSEAGRGVFVLSFLPEDEATRIINYSANKGIKNIALLLPMGKYGERVEKAAIETANSRGLKIISKQYYDPLNENNSLNIAELDKAAKLTAQAIKPFANRKETAILMPERGAILKQIVKTLNLNGATPSHFQYIGTGLWNDKNTINDSKMFGGWFTSTESSERAKFAEEFKKANNLEATRFAGLGFDAMSLIAQTAKKGEKSAINSRLLERNSGFIGIDGRFRFNDGIIERSMPIMEIGGTGLKIIEAAPNNY